MARIRGLHVPELLIDMLGDGRWGHPGIDAIKRVMPFMADPLVFLSSLDVMERESRVEVACEALRIHRGSCTTQRSQLPWLDIENAFFVAINEQLGDDVAVALDYRLDSSVPRVVASEYDDNSGYSWRFVATSFADLVQGLALQPFGR